LLTGSNLALLHRLIQLLNSEFKLRHLEVIYYFLGIEAHPATMGLMLRQDKHVLDCLFSYLIFMRSDIFFVVNKVCQYKHSPTYSYWTVVKLILCYLKGMASFGLHITLSSSFLHGFTNVDYAGSVDDRKSMGG